jgi:hypothetical protein
MTEKKSKSLQTWDDLKGVPQAQQIYDAGVKDGMKLSEEEKPLEGFNEAAKNALQQHSTRWGFQFGDYLGREVIGKLFEPYERPEIEPKETGPSFRERAGNAANVAGRVARVAFNIYQRRKGAKTSSSTEIVTDDDIIEATFVED